MQVRNLTPKGWVQSICEPPTLPSRYPKSHLIIFPIQNTSPPLYYCHATPSLNTKLFADIGDFLAAMTAISTATLSAAALSGSSLGSTMRKKSGTVFIEGLNSFGGLKANTNVASLGMGKCADQSFAIVMSSLKSGSVGKKGKGGALSSTCNAVAEIFKIAAIMNGLTLVGVAVGFVLLRIEATLEEE